MQNSSGAAEDNSNHSFKSLFWEKMDKCPFQKKKKKKKIQHFVIFSKLIREMLLF